MQPHPILRDVEDSDVEASNAVGTGNSCAVLAECVVEEERFLFTENHRTADRKHCES